MRMTLERAEEAMRTETLFWISAAHIDDTCDEDQQDFIGTEEEARECTRKLSEESWCAGASVWNQSKSGWPHVGSFENGIEIPKPQHEEV